MVTAAFCLSKCFAHNVHADAGNLDVHLEAGDTVVGASYLEVHVAKVIFFTKNIRKDCVFLVLWSVGDEAHCDTGNHLLHWNASCEQ